MNIIMEYVEKMAFHGNTSIVITKAGEVINLGMNIAG